MTRQCTRSNYKTLPSLGRQLSRLMRFHGRVLGKGMGGIKVHPWVCIGHRAREDHRPELTGIMREVVRMMCTIYSTRISAIHVKNVRVLLVLSILNLLYYLDR